MEETRIKLKHFVYTTGLKSKAKFACCHEQYLKRIFVKSKLIAFETAVLLKKQPRNKISRVVLEIYGGKFNLGKAISEDFKFRYYHKITKLVKKRILADTMILVTTPQEQHASRLVAEGL